MALLNVTQSIALFHRFGHYGFLRKTLTIVANIGHKSKGRRGNNGLPVIGHLIGRLSIVQTQRQDDSSIRTGNLLICLYCSQVQQ